MPVDDTGLFLDKFGWMTGKNSHDIADEVFQKLEEAGKLYKVMEYEHSYPVCWRCKSEVIFRLVPAWYIRTQELKPRLIAAAEKVKWEPASNGKRMQDWLNNMGDWNISRKRYYGMPLPFYPCDLRPSDRSRLQRGVKEAEYRPGKSGRVARDAQAMD